MNIPEYLKEARKVLSEDAGSEGMRYLIEARKGLKAVETKTFVIKEVKTANDVQSANIEFVYPHDYGFALSEVKAALPELDVIALKLVY